MVAIKKTWMVFLALLLSFSFLSACASEEAETSETEEDTSEIDAQEDEEGEDEEEDDTTSEKGDKYTSDADLTAIIVSSHTWYENDDAYHKYEIKILNDSDEDITSWTATITFENDIELSDHWNGIYEEDDQTLTITNESYNGDISSGEATVTFGFIVYGEEMPKIKDITIE